MTTQELKAYLQRISYSGSTEPVLEVLHAITKAHAQAIPFENLDVVLNRPILLSEEAILEKLVMKRRGGYCFEQNALMLNVLKHLGFNAKPLSARVRLRYATRDIVAPRTHLFVQVEIGKESYITDVGMGAASLTSALKLVTDIEQETAHDFRRIVKEGSVWYHQIRYGDVWQDACEFTLEEMPQLDREIANWYTSAHPQSHFKGSLMVAKALDNGQRVTLQNYDLTYRSRNNETQKKHLQNKSEVIAALENDFGLLLTNQDREGLKNEKSF